jgi:hypothetical protein
MNYPFRKKITYLLKARHRGGHGIHSPFLFRLITEVIENKGNFTAYPMLAAARENVDNILKILDMEFYGQEDVSLKDYNEQYIKSLHLLPARFDRLLFRLVNDFRPPEIAFYGSTFGVTLLALALADRRIPLKARVENDHYRSFCRRLIEVYELSNILITGSEEVTASDFVVVQHPMDPAYCERVIVSVLSEESFDGVVVLCGIHTSGAMEAVWTRGKLNQKVRISLDLFEVGIFICKRGLQKEEFVLRF